MTNQPKKASTISVRNTATAAPSTKPSEEELYRMPMEKLKELANKQLAEAEAQSGFLNS